MRELTALAATAGLATVLGCAQIGEPPGGPPDRAPPILIGTHPESTAVLPGFKGDAAFLFDEIVSEGGSPNFGLGTGDLERLIVLSPSEQVPVVRWRRSRITIRPREGWQPGRVYRIELLPGIVDLRNNRSAQGEVITFTTGAPLPTRVLTGRVVDWTTARPVPQALVEAILQPDSLVYRTAADSTGRFQFGPLPDGEYLLSAAVDQNRNRRRDPRELFDTLRLAAAQDSAGEIWVFRHDTVPPRIQTLAFNDSISLAATFNQHLNPYQRLPADSVRVRALPDSIDVAVAAILPRAAYDSLFRPRPPARDTAAADTLPPREPAAAPPTPAPPPAGARRQAPADTGDRGPLTSRPVLFDQLLIRTESPLEPGGRYVVEIRGIENVSRISGTAIQGIQIPARPAPPTRPAADTARADSVPPPADTTGRPPADTGVRRARRELRR